MADDVENKEQEKQAPASGWQLIRFDALKNPPVGLAASIYVLAAIFAFAVLVLVGFGLFASFHVAYETAVGDFDNRIEAAKVFFPILLALVGGPLLIWRVVTAHVQATAARHQADVAQEGLYTSLFTKAVEQLGATREVKAHQEVDDGVGGKKREAVTVTEPNLEVRLGAIYALDRVARDSARDHWPIMEVLCAYVRNPQNTGSPMLLPEKSKVNSSEFAISLSSIKAPRVDVQAALTVIGQRPESRRVKEADEKLRLDLRNANLQSAVLNGGYFDDAIFERAHLDSASFERAHLNRATFFGAKLAGAIFNEAELSNASFIAAQLVGASFSNSHLAQARFGAADIAGTKFFDTDLSQVRFIGARRLEHSMGDRSTLLPESMTRPAAWPDRNLSWGERYDWTNEGNPPPPEAS